MKIVFLDGNVIPKHITFPKPDFEHQWINYEYTAPNQVVERLIDAEIAITSKVIFNHDIFKQLPKLKLIALTATGTNNIDLNAAKEHGVCVKNVTDYAATSLSEHVIAMIFALKHNLMGWYQDQLTDRWATHKQFCCFDYPITDVQGSTLGIFGKGNLGSEVGRLAKLLGMNVLYAERQYADQCRAGYVPFEEVLMQADIITLHCTLTEHTHNMINSNTLILCKKGALLINTGRGLLVDEQALLEALNTGQLGGAALDVLSIEPPKKEDSLMQAAKTLPNLLITPHIAWASNSALHTLVNKVIENINQFVKTGK